jgi:hypothetical protein
MSRLSGQCVIRNISQPYRPPEPCYGNSCRDLLSRLLGMAQLYPGYDCEQLLPSSNTSQYVDVIRTSQDTHYVSATEPSWLEVFTTVTMRDIVFWDIKP